MHHGITPRAREMAMRVIGGLAPFCLLVTLVIVLSGCTQYSPFRNQRPAAQPVDTPPVAARPSDRPPTFEFVSHWDYQDPPAVPPGYHSVRRMQRFSFASGSSALNLESNGALREIVDDLKANTRWHVLVVGFTDAMGEANANQFDLSMDRAKAARGYLVRNGIDESRISTMAVGSRYAEGDQYEPATTASDRRVEVWAFMM